MTQVKQQNGKLSTIQITDLEGLSLFSTGENCFSVFHEYLEKIHTILSFNTEIDAPDGKYASTRIGNFELLFVGSTGHEYTITFQGELCESFTAAMDAIIKAIKN